jgi:poly(hydroxyalkanoate) granule-associated protein
MAKKTLKKKVQAKSTSSNVVTPVMDSAREIWLAGLGALAVAQDQSGKIIEQGNMMFDKLVKEGAKIEKKINKAAEDTVDDIRDGVDSRLGDIRDGVDTRLGSVRQQAVDNWDKLEKVFEERVARALGRLGVPTAAEVRELSVRVQQLTAKVAKASRAPAKKRAAKKPAARKAAAKPVAKPAASKTEKAAA